MNNRNAARPRAHSFMYVTVLCLGALLTFGIFGLSGCGAPAEDTSIHEQSSSGNEDQVTSEVVTGKITTISSTELLIEASDEGNDSLQGDVRVDVSQIDSTLVESLSVGDTIVVQYSGQVGMSEPPFISATAIETKT